MPAIRASTASNVQLAINDVTPTQIPLQINPVGDVDLYQVTLAEGDVLTANIGGATERHPVDWSACLIPPEAS